MSTLFGIYALAVRLIDGRPFFMPNEESPIEDASMPDQTPDNPDNESEELYGMPEELINPELVEKNRLYDEKIERMKAELDAYQNPEQFILDENIQRVGVVFDEDHVEVDKRYIPKPTHEYTDQG